MTVSCIIPLYNCLALTQAMLASLRATLPPGLAHEIVFVDDGSTDGTRAWLAGLQPPVRVLLNERNAGFAVSCNRGAAAATGEFLAFLNNDLVLQPGWLEPMLRLVRRRRAGLVGNVQRHATTGALDHTGIFFNRQGKPEHARGRFPSGILPRFLMPYPLSVRRVPALTGACFVVRSDVWREFGGFDEGYVNGGEDVDLCLRAVAAGRRNYVALRSVVRHHVSQSPGRKLRDEQNSRRLTLRWSDAIARLAARDWCRAYLEARWSDPDGYSGFGLAWEAFLYRWHLRSRPPAAALAGARVAVERELERWRRLFPEPPDVSLRRAAGVKPGRR